MLIMLLSFILFIYISLEYLWNSHQSLFHKIISSLAIAIFFLALIFINYVIADVLTYNVLTTKTYEILPLSNGYLVVDCPKTWAFNTLTNYGLGVQNVDKSIFRYTIGIGHSTNNRIYVEIKNVKPMWVLIFMPVYTYNRISVLVPEDFDHSKLIYERKQK